MKSEKDRSIRALEWTNFFVADVQTGLGPFLAAYLAGAGWRAGRVGLALTLGGVTALLVQLPAGEVVDRVRSKRMLVVVAAVVLAVGAVLLSLRTDVWAVYGSQVLIGGAGPFLMPTLAALTLGLVGARGFDRQFGRNQGFNSAGNLAAAALVAWVSRRFGNEAIFLASAVLVVPTIASVLAVRAGDIDYEAARGGVQEGESGKTASIAQVLVQDRVLGVFLVCAFFFHFANAAMLPQLGEMLARGDKRPVASLMAACVAVTQLAIMLSAAWVGRWANAHGRRPLLLVAFAVLPLRALLYTVVHGAGWLIAVQVLDGLANAIFGVVSVLVIADRTRGTGRFNLVQGALAAAVGLGAALSTTLGGRLVERVGFSGSFLALGGLAAVGLCLLAVGVPETRRTVDG